MTQRNDPTLTRRDLLKQAVVTGVVSLSRQQIASSEAITRETQTATEVINLPPKALRGIGTQSAIFRRFQLSNGPASVLQITCESPPKALLMQAKYLSDARLLPGTRQIELRMSTGPRAALASADGNIFAAFAADRMIGILAASSDADIVALMNQFVPSETPAKAFLARVEIPMYLDRFDKHGLMSYYQPLREPGPAKPDAHYEFSKDFDFAAQNKIGLVLWDNEMLNDTAEGLANLAAWRWAADEARARHLPVHINTSCGPALWLTNRFRGETMQKQPQYCGNHYRIGEADMGTGTLSWAALAGQDVELGVLQETVRRFAGFANVVGWLEPHGEEDYPPLSWLAEYGPVADSSFRRYLKARYASLSDLGKAWDANPNTTQSWEHVHVPELASFLGWGPEALDLTGEWKIAYATAADGHAYTRDEARRFGNQPTPSATIPREWYQPAFDDAAWGSIRLPGNDRQMFLVGAPAVIRRTLGVSAAWLARHSRQWLYVWDLSEVIGERYDVAVNGHAAELHGSALQHWGVAEVTGMLRDGANSIAIRLPKGFLGYRCYIAPTPPLQYPALGKPMNTRWSDFVGWSRAVRSEALRRGAEMIRQIDPDRPINFMYPDSYLDLVGQICADLGGHFHNTGYMAGFWSEYNPLIARSAGRPATAEPGNGAETVRDFQACWGRWLTEGIQSVHYFQHLGDIMWNPAVRDAFLANRALYETIGKYHVPRAEVAILYGLRSSALTTWPWGQDPNTNMPGGYWAFNTAYSLLNVCPRDGVTETSFENGDAAKYRVIVDSNTSIMTEELVERIGEFVRAGGTFVTFGQTGRHTPTSQGAWPIDALTGYTVVRIDRYSEGNWPAEYHGLKLAPHQPVFQSKAWDAGVRGCGLSLRRVAPDAQDLMLWEDGSVAAGLRPLGSGRVIHLGVTFEALGDRTASPLLTALLGQIIDHLAVARVPARAPKVMLRHYISNNGIYDLWMLFNESDSPVTTDFTFIGHDPPQKLFEAKTAEWTRVSLQQNIPGIYGLTLNPMETRLFQSSRARFERAPLEWLHVQRDWWAGTTPAPATRLPTPAHDQQHSIDLSDDWAFQGIDGLSEAAIAKLAGVDIDDTSWERRSLGLWGLPDHAPLRRAMWRKRFSVPTHWSGGETQLWLRSWFSTTFHDRGRVFLDGRWITEFSADGPAGIDVDKFLQPGSTHLIAVDIAGNGPLRGVDGSAWIYHVPDPATKLDLGGNWMISGDGIHDTGTSSLPGLFKGRFAMRSLLIDVAQAHRNAVVYIHADGPVFGVLINGELVCRHHHMIGRVFCICITPKVKFGADNRIELVTLDPTAECRILSIELRFYDRGVYP